MGSVLKSVAECVISSANRPREILAELQASLTLENLLMQATEVSPVKFLLLIVDKSLFHFRSKRNIERNVGGGTLTFALILNKFQSGVVNYAYVWKRVPVYWVSSLI